MIRYFIYACLYSALLTAAYYGIPKHLDIIEADSAFNECMQDLTLAECRLGVYGD